MSQPGRTDGSTTPGAPPPYGAPAGGPGGQTGGRRPFGTPRQGFGSPSGRPPRRTGVLTGLVSLPMTVLFFPIGGLLGIVAAVLAIRALKSRERAQIVGRAVTGLATGLISIVLALAFTVMVAVYWPQVRTYTDCQRSAVTNKEQQVCRQQLVDGVSRRMGVDPAQVPAIGTP